MRQEGWDAPIIVIGEEAELPYHRPPLSKELLSGKKALEQIYLRPAALYQKQNIEFKLSTRVSAIDREQQQIALADGQVLKYAKLALCTGSRVRQLSIPGFDVEKQLAGVHYLRTYRDVDRIKAGAADARSVVIIGGGYIGLETAAVLNQLGLEVTVLEMSARVLERVTAPVLSDFFHRIHSQHGVNIECQKQVLELVGEKTVTSVVCQDGSNYNADMVIIGIGILPNTELAADAGLECDNGILVNQFAQTSDPNIVAAGDCTSHPNKYIEKNIRLESVPNASEQAKSAAASLCGKQKAYHALPWFWSDQYDIKLQIAGLNTGYTETVVRGDPTSNSFVVWYFNQERLVAADCVNSPMEFMLAKQFIQNGIAVDKAALVDTEINLKTLL
jgi:3-phenylpropionate/trans-cinnamate dioxygenase ferredoxin reductase subunit